MDQPVTTKENSYAELLSSYQEVKRQFDKYMDEETSIPGTEYRYQYLYDRVLDAQEKLDAFLAGRPVPQPLPDTEQSPSDLVK